MIPQLASYGRQATRWYQPRRGVSSRLVRLQAESDKRLYTKLSSCLNFSLSGKAPCSLMDPSLYPPLHVESILVKTPSKIKINILLLLFWFCFSHMLLPFPTVAQSPESFWAFPQRSVDAVCRCNRWHCTVSAKFQKKKTRTLVSVREIDLKLWIMLLLPCFSSWHLEKLLLLNPSAEPACVLVER